MEMDNYDKSADGVIDSLHDEIAALREENKRLRNGFSLLAAWAKRVTNNGNDHYPMALGDIEDVVYDALTA